MNESIDRGAAMEELFDTEINRRTALGHGWIDEIRGSFVALCTKLEKVVDAGNTIFICGNGGSAAQAQHFCAEIVGRYRRDSRPAPALSLTVDTSALTSLGNDYGFDEVFQRQAQALMREGDILVGLSTSGTSANVVKALSWARENGHATAALTGEGGGTMASISDFCIAVPFTDTDLIQERHLVLLHILAEVAERVLTAEQ
jgi:D-sedoheptulose 7-phosphate isomerase